MPWSRPTTVSPTPVCRDDTLSVDVFDMLDECIQAMDPVEQKFLFEFLQGKQDPGQAKSALVKIWEHSPSMFKRLQDASASETMDLATLSPSLLAWAMNQPWAESIDMKRAMTKWTGYVITKNPNSEEVHIPRACAYLEQFLPLVPRILSTPKSVAVGYLYNELSWLTSTNESHPKLGALMALMGMLTSHSRTPVSNYYVPLPDQWVSTSHAILYAKNRLEPERNAIGCDIAASALADDLKALVLTACPGQVWARPDVAMLLLPTLPANESERFEHLPWSGNNNEEALADNRAVLATYCPRIAPLVDMLATEDDWLDQDAIAQRVQECGHQEGPPVETFDLPFDLEPS